MSKTTDATCLEQPAHLLFLVVLGVFGILHWMIYTFWWQYGNYFSLHLIGAFGAWLIIQPRSAVPLIGLALALAADSWLQAPVYSNHTMLKTFVVLGIGCAGLEGLIRRRNRNWIMKRFASYGCVLLLGLYFFGIFHKINSGFLNPEVSCAVALWHEMPLPQWAKHSMPLHYAGIYGTFVIEGLIALCLILKRFRHVGIMVGIGFHMLLASSSYEFYSAFTMLTVALHVLFLPANAHETMLQDPLVKQFIKCLRSPLGILLAITYIATLSLYTHMGMVTSVGLGMFIASLPLIVAIWRSPGMDSQPFRMLSVKSVWMPALILLFLFNGFTPYLGIKTAQSFNMFANLRLESGVSNHLIITRAPNLYLQDTVRILEGRSVRWPMDISDPDLRLTYYDFLNLMERSDSSSPVTYQVNEGTVEVHTREDLRSEFKRVLHPRWVRKWLHFTPIDLSEPKRCGVNF